MKPANLARGAALWFATTLLAHMLGVSGWRWYRRLCGGHWERWYIDVPVCADVWHRRQHNEGRPCVIARGTPTCEDWL